MNGRKWKGRAGPHHDCEGEADDNAQQTQEALGEDHPGVLYSPLQAVRLARKTSTTKFHDSTVEVMYRLGVDPCR